ncbi:hypothetical protein [Actinomadura rubrisoli]|uniref:Uncharacterized protein n=1 Tax=Actinomadura rubrisoli TaxID=2530368 RepID=A0A4R5CF05_9ACTN|nr:hypothetical protein [Actinomadura rubrisoli]TDD97579.1 hypothetical protein E1298_00685 [Actinomadura rubrisoli]
MSDDQQLGRSLMQAVGSASVAVTMIDNAAGGDPWKVLVEVRTALVRGFNGRPLVRPQTCPRGVHRDWWADAEDLVCPWCRIAALEGNPAAAADETDAA